MEPIIFSSIVEHKEYLILTFLQYFQNVVIWFIYIICFYCIYNSLSTDTFSQNNELIIIASIMVMILIPTRAFFRIRNAYKTNPASGIDIHWTITESSVSFSQGSVSSQVGWDRITKITDNKKWIMLWYGKRPALNFQKRFLSVAQTNDFKKIIHQMRKGYLKY